MKSLHMGAFLLVIIGALNWGLIGLFDFNLVDALFGSMSMLSKLVYVLVGASAVYLVVTHAKECKACMTMTKKKQKSTISWIICIKLSKSF